ncbi:MAG: alpha/beta hydrolase, partial [Pseudomonadales bacterium]
MQRISLMIVVIVAGLSAPIGATAETTIVSDVVYGHKDGMALVYDVFVPEEANGAGIVYMVSGGWFSVWQAPDRRATHFERLLAEGFTVFAVHHGSAPRFKVPEAVSDVRAAVRHIKKSAPDYGVDRDRLGVWGGSAGGHLSLMLGLNPEGKPAEPVGQGFRQLGPHYAVDGTDDATVAAVVAFYPPVDIRHRVGPSERFPALDFPKDQADAISPILFVTKDDPPVRLIHGDADELVPLEDSEILQAELERVGVAHDLVVIKGGDHGFRDTGHR